MVLANGPDFGRENLSSRICAKFVAIISRSGLGFVRNGRLKIH